MEIYTRDDLVSPVQASMWRGIEYNQLWRCGWSLFFFFFQAEDGIRDVAVTGVQTCALPIFALLGSYLLLILTAPVPPHGDATEFTQRPFVLVYGVFAVWTAAGFAGWLSL